MTSVTDSPSKKPSFEPNSVSAEVIADSIQTLKRALVVVSLFTVGQDSEVDDELDEMRHDIRDSISTNAPISEKFVKRVEKLEGMLKDYERQNALGTEKLISHVQKQAAQLLDQTSNDALEMTLRTLRRDAGIDLQTWKGCRDQVTRWVDLYEQVFAEAGAVAEAAASASSVKQQDTVTDDSINSESVTAESSDSEIHLSEDDVSESEAIADFEDALDNIDGIDINDVDEDDSESFDSNTINQEAIELVTRTARALADLVKRLSVSDNFKQTRDELLSRLEVSGPEADWQLLLDEVTNLVLASLKTNSLEIAQFFRSLEQHVGSVQSFISSDDIQPSGNRKKLTAGLLEDMKNARERLHSWYDPAMAAEEVEAYLKKMEARLDKFNELEAEREKELEDRIEGVERRLQQITDEAIQAQKNLDDHLRTKMRKATHDGLTGLPNRAAYQVKVKESWAEMSLNPEEEFSLIVSDVDEFSVINTKFGHQAGDRVLKIIAAALRKTLPKKEFLARISGQKFVAVIRSDVQGASVIADILRSAVEAIPCHFQGKPVPITMSFGVAAARKGEPSHLTYDRAEKALVKAQEDGRNQVVKAPA